jgi:hypothetical protein
MSDQNYTIIETNWGIHLSTFENFVTNADNMPVIIKEIVLKCHESDKKRVLIDARTMIRKSSIVAHFNYSELAQSIGAAGFKFAVISSKYAVDPDTRFIEDFNYNRGIYVQYFSEMAEGLEWLVDK